MCEIRTSDRIAFKRCRRKWNLSSHLRNNLQPQRVNDKLWLGSGVHYALEQYYKDGVSLVPPFKKWCAQQIDEMKARGDLWQEQVDMLDEQIILGSGILRHYEMWAKEEDPKWWSKVFKTEMSVKVPIIAPDGTDTGAHYALRVDAIVQDEYDLYWLLEHKTAAMFDNSKLPLDEQCGSYIWALQKLLGIELQGVIYNQLRKKVPARPEALAKGGLSKNKGCDTTAQMYLQVLDEYYDGRENVPMAEYSAILEELQKKGNTFFNRVKVHRSQKEIKDIGERIYYEYLDMARPDLICYPNPTRDCGWDCDFRSVCLAMNDGSDYEQMLRDLYMKRPEDTAEYVESI